MGNASADGGTALTVSQSTVIVGALMASFVGWLAVNGRLPVYWSILNGKAAS